MEKIDRKAGKGLGRLESCGSSKIMCTGKKKEFDCSFGRNFDTRISGQQIKSLEKYFEGDS